MIFLLFLEFDPEMEGRLSCEDKRKVGPAPEMTLRPTERGGGIAWLSICSCVFYIFVAFPQAVGVWEFQLS